MRLKLAEKIAEIINDFGDGAKSEKIIQVVECTEGVPRL